jgi:deoxyribodipyrimidine photo-lyase
MKCSFPTDLPSIESRLSSVDPIAYGNSRNYIDGAVTTLSPYISRGFLSTKQVFDRIRSLDVKHYKVSKFLQELAWRDYYQQIWIHKGEEISLDLKQSQPLVKHNRLPKCIFENSIATGIQGIDRELTDFYENGYLHNHVRMYLAAIICNVGGAHWKMPSEWMYYHLLDADYASNTCSWQWVAGAFSSKKYIANQENINRYLKTNEMGTYLDKSYEEIGMFDKIPDELVETVEWDRNSAYESTKIWFIDKLKYLTNESNSIIFTDKYENLKLDSKLPLYLYDFYNIDPYWHKEETANRILLLRPSFFKKYPCSPKTLDFVFGLSQNIPSLQIFWGEWEDLSNFVIQDNGNVVWKEHPTNKGFIGTEEPRAWMFPEVKGYFPSFFTYWKKCEKMILNNISKI